MKRFTGFHPHPTAWITPAPELTEIGKNPGLLLQDALRVVEDGYTLRVANDGMICLSVDKLESEIADIQESWKDLSEAKSFDEVWGQYLEYMNVLYFLLESAMHYPEKRNMKFFDLFELNRTNLRRVTYDENDRPTSQTTYGSSQAQDLLRLGRIDAKGQDRAPGAIGVDVLKDLAELFNQVFKAGLTHEVRRIAGIVACAKVRDYESALLWGWIWLESQISWLWTNHLDVRGITGERKKRMLGRDYTASIQIDTLEMAGVLPTDEAMMLTLLRQCRNDLVHDGQLKSGRPTLEQAVSMVVPLVRKYFRTRHGFDLYFDHLGNSTHGL